MTMKRNLLLATVATLGLTLGACANGEPQAITEPENAEAPESVTAQSNPQAAPETTQETTGAIDHDSTVSQGGQVIESGPYHLELVTFDEGNGIHLDFYLQKGDTHEAIPNAKVTAQVQRPDGSQASIDLDYDAQGGHYAALLPTTATGEYNVVILSDIEGEKVNGRFRFTK